MGSSNDTDFAAHAEALRRDGYTLIEQALSPAEVGTLAAVLARVEAAQSQKDDRDQPFLNRGHKVLYNLQNYDAAFLRTFLDHGLTRSILLHLLNDPWYRQIPAGEPNFILRAIAGRSSGPTVLPLHLDSFIPGAGETCWALQAAVALEDQSLERGCTLVVPGSHRSDRYAPPEALEQAIPVTPRAGDIVIWDGRLWHAAAANRTGATRWSIIATFARWWVKQNYDIPRALPDAIYQGLSDQEKAVLGFCSLPPRDDLERVDIKTGYADLRPSVMDYR